MKPVTIVKLSFLLGLTASLAWAQVPIDGKFSYSGRLTENGGAFNQEADFEFSLWDGPDDGQGTQHGPTLTFDGAGGNPGPIDVDQGLFMVQLDFGVEVFDGNARWLQIAVRNHAAGGAYTTLSPRQELTPAPYAVQTRGLFVDDNLLVGVGTTNPQYRLDVRSPAPRAIFGWVTNPDGDTTGVMGQTASSAGDGVTGFATASTGLTTGVFGLVNSTSGRGVSGLATANSGTNYGLHGESQSSSGRAVYGLASNSSGTSYGVYGEARSSGNFASGVYGTATSATGLTYGVRGQSASTSGFGVYGLATAATGSTRGVAGLSESSGGTGVLGIAASSTGTNYAVSGHTDSPGGYSGHFTGAAGSRNYFERSVGIGESDPLTTLHVRTADISLESGDINSHADVLIEDTDAQLALYSNAGGVGASNLVFGQLNGGVFEDKWVIHKRTGGELRFLYNNTDPAGFSADNDWVMRLVPNGTTQVRVLEIAGADLAEKFPASEELKPGMVAAIDPANPGKLCVARGAYNRGVAGVVSGANNFSAGAVLGNLPGHEDAPPIALSGRVYVLCDATEHAIEPTDLLTSSDTPGHAMKVIDHAQAQGAVLGKAMSGLAQGEKGMVLVLVNLQ